MSLPSPFADALRGLAPDCPVLIAGPTASGKSALALEIAQEQGGVIINADASQVYDCWRVITARPSIEEERIAPHALYGHIAPSAPYSTGHWLREVTTLLQGGARPIVTGGTGLYFKALTEGLADIPPTPPETRATADQLPLDALLAGIDPVTRDRIDTVNRARVQRAWEVQSTTGRGLAHWQAQTAPPVLPLKTCAAFVLDVEKDWLNARIEARFDQMLAQGALDEVRAELPRHDARLPAYRAIGVPPLTAYLRGEITLEAAREMAIITSRRFAKRQRTWMRNQMRNWRALPVGA